MPHDLPTVSTLGLSLYLHAIALLASATSPPLAAVVPTKPRNPSGIALVRLPKLKPELVSSQQSPPLRLLLGWNGCGGGAEMHVRNTPVSPQARAVLMSEVSGPLFFVGSISFAVYYSVSATIAEVT